MSDILSAYHDVSLVSPHPPSLKAALMFVVIAISVFHLNSIASASPTYLTLLCHTDKRT